MSLKIKYEQENLIIKSGKKQWHFTRELISVVILSLFYGFGTLGISLPITRDIFAVLTPFNLVLSLGLVLYNHKEWSNIFVITAILCGVIGYFSEVIGVQTGLIFGEYEYGNTLGFQLFEVPVILAINWLLLLYCSAMVVSMFGRHLNIFVRVLISAALMVGLDVLIEPVAIELDFWAWAGGNVPFQNYIGWFIIAFILQFTFHKATPKDATNHVAVILFGWQIVFFGVLNWTLF
ncbi:MAG: carotenoid biosynthesis protein [Saprospiraceae bacterium]